MKLQVLIVGMSVLAMSSTILAEIDTADLVAVDSDIGYDEIKISDLNATLGIGKLACRPPIEICCLSVGEEYQVPEHQQGTAYAPVEKMRLPEQPGGDVFLEMIKAADRHNVRLCG